MVADNGTDLGCKLLLKAAEHGLGLKKRPVGHLYDSAQGVQRPSDRIVLVSGDQNGISSLDERFNGNIQPMSGVKGKNHIFRLIYAKEGGRLLAAGKGGPCGKHGGAVTPSARAGHGTHGGHTGRDTEGGFCIVVAALSR